MKLVGAYLAGGHGKGNVMDKTLPNKADTFYLNTDGIRPL